MALQIIRKADKRVVKAFTTKCADIPGGVTVSSADLVQPILLEGTPVGKGADNLYHVIKTAVATATSGSTATTYTVAKGHDFKVGDVIATGLKKKASTISSIATSEDDATMDVITCSATLGEGVAVGDVLIQAKAATTSNASAFKYEPVGLVGESYDVDYVGSNLVNVVLIGVLKASNAPKMNADVKATLTNIIYI